jgi:hypothetical protein
MVRRNRQRLSRVQSAHSLVSRADFAWKIASWDCLRSFGRMVELLRVHRNDFSLAARIFLSSRNFSEGGCSMRITEDVRRYAAEQHVSEDAIKRGLEEKAAEFSKAGELYQKV